MAIVPDIFPSNVREPLLRGQNVCLQALQDSGSHSLVRHSTRMSDAAQRLRSLSLGTLVSTDASLLPHPGTYKSSEPTRGR